MENGDLYVLDRIEDGTAVFIADGENGDVITLPLEAACKFASIILNEKDVCRIHFSDNTISKIEVFPDEKEARIKKNTSRLAALFGRNKK